MIVHKPPIRTELAEICRKLEREKCIDHRKHPFAKVQDDNIVMLVCCEKFRSCLNQIKEKEMALLPPVDLPDKKHVLVIDGEIDFCLLMEFYLTRKGKRVNCAYSLEEAMNYLETNKPGIILIDKWLYSQATFLENSGAIIYVIGSNAGGFTDGLDELFQ